MWSKGRRHILMLLILVVVAITMTIGSVYATWDYTNVSPVPLEKDIKTNLFIWQEIPDGDEGIIIEETGTAIENSLNNVNSGLNSTIDSKQMWGLTSVSSVDNLHGSDLRAELGLDATANFLVEFPDENTRIVYTTTVEIGGSSSFGAVEYLIPRGEYIYPVYKTIATKNADGIWVQGATMRGYARSDEYVTFLSAAPFFDANSWTRGKIGTSISNAIYVYNGQRVNATLDTDTEKIYYKMVIANTRTRTKVTIASPSSATVTVLDANGKRLNVKNNGTSSVKFTNQKANTTYYLEVTGAKNIVFDIM